MIIEILFIVAMFCCIAVSAFFVLYGLFKLADWCWTRWDRWMIRRAGEGV